MKFGQIKARNRPLEGVFITKMVIQKVFSAKQVILSFPRASSKTLFYYWINQIIARCNYGINFVA